MPSKSTDLVTIDGPMTHADVVGYLEQPDRYEFVPFERDPEEVAREIAARDLSAPTAEALFGEIQVIHGDGYLNRPFQLTGVAYQASTIEGGEFPFYAVLSIVDTDGAVQVMTTGAGNVMRKAAIAASKGWLPQWLKITKADTPTKSGYYPLNLVAAPAAEVEAARVNF